MELRELNKFRIKAIIALLLGIVAVIVVFLLCVKYFQSLEWALIAALPSIIYIWRLNHQYRLKFKEYFVKKPLENIFTELKFLPETPLKQSNIEKTELIQEGDTYESNDLMVATYKNIQFVQADVELKNLKYSMQVNHFHYKRYKRIFKGRWMIFDFNKTFKSNVQIIDKKFKRIKKKNGTSFNKIEVEDIIFNKKFRIYTTNAHEAFYILTPQLIEKMQRLVKNIKGEVIFSFLDSKLHVGVNNKKDSFEHSIFRRINEAKVIENISKDIKLITSFVDELSLDNTLFKN